jgi:uncharacterized protein (TIGR03083 family)
MRPSKTPTHVAEMIRAERLGLCEVLRSCSPEAWSTPSLCDGWAIRDVVAHLALATTETWRSFSVGMVRHRGNFDRLVSTQATIHAARHTPAELIAQLERTATAIRRSPGSAPTDPLLDLLVHGQDIARPLRIERRVPADAGTVALNHAVSSRWYGAKKRLADLTITATDAEWTHGSGANIRGPVAALLLVTTGRPTGLADLHGPGLAILEKRIGDQS